MGAQGRRRSEGFTLIEVMIALAVTLAIMATLYLVARSSALLHDTETRRTERGMSGLRALDDIALEIARAGMGPGNDLTRSCPAGRAWARPRTR
jgi:prepilin-type N-terminal cleavage/methylation domain-containing protein